MNHEGIGLGLVIVKKIIEQVGGSIAIKSDGLGKGSVFEFIMPLQIDKEELSEIKREKEESFSDQPRDEDSSVSAEAIQLDILSVSQEAQKTSRMNIDDYREDLMHSKKVGV